jgi:hypothetical protein
MMILQCTSVVYGPLETFLQTHHDGATAASDPSVILSAN